MTVAIYYGLDRTVLPKFLCPSMLLRLIPSIREEQNKALGDRLYLACVSLGPLFIKFGQLISIRHDFFSEDIVKPLAQLQDNVPAFDTGIAIETIESSLKKPLNKLFLAFDPKPIASASIAQVYQATLYNKDTVVVKVIKPYISEQLKVDIRLLRGLCTLVAIGKRWSRSTLKALINEYEYSLKQELDLSKEASHYSQMKHNFKGDHRLYVPKVYWDYSSSNVLTLEKINGIPIDEIDEHMAIDRKALAENGISIFFTQVFKHRFFHADMHPGNVFVLEGNPAKYAAVDFGIVGSLSPHDQYYLAENFLAFHHRNYMRIAILHIEAGWVDPNSSLIEFEASIRHVCEPIFSKNIEDISIADLMRRLVEAAKPFKLNVQPQLLLLQKTLFYVEAMGRQLYPKLNLWEATEPFIQSFMKERTGLKTGMKQLKEELPRILEITPKLPYLLKKHLEQPKNDSPPKFIYVGIGIFLGIVLSNNGLTRDIAVYTMGASFITTILCKYIK